MAVLNSLSASPVSIGPGGKSIITPAVSGGDKTATLSGTLDGSAATVTIGIHQPVTLSVNPADVGKTGVLVLTVDQGGTLSLTGDGTFTFTAS
jgi:hypothetical protein